MGDKNEEVKIDQQSIFDIINSIQDKMGSSKSDNSKESVHINENSNDKASSAINNTTSPLQSILGNLDMGKISSILEAFNTGDNASKINNDTSTNSTKSDINFDMNTILKMQKIMGRLNKEDPKKNLLLSLKPFLRKNRQDKLDTYMGMLNIWNIIGMFSEGSDIL